MTVTEFVILSLCAADLRLPGALLAALVRRCRETLKREGAAAMRAQLFDYIDNRMRSQCADTVIDGFRITAIIVH